MSGTAPVLCGWFASVILYVPINIHERITRTSCGLLKHYRSALFVASQNERTLLQLPLGLLHS